MADNTRHYGINNYRAEYCAHVCVVAQTIYMYRVEDMRQLVYDGDYKKKPSFTDGQITAWGYPVPVEDIPLVQSWTIATDTIDRYLVAPTDTFSARGNMAVSIALDTWMRSYDDRTYETIMGTTATGYHEQLQGQDVRVKWANGRVHTVQVKCDYLGGIGDGCYGNLYVQVAECNPTKSY